MSRNSDGDGALVIFGFVLGIIVTLFITFVIFALDGKSIFKDSKINVNGKLYRVLSIDDSNLIGSTNVSTITIGVNKIN